MSKDKGAMVSRRKGSKAQNGTKTKPNQTIRPSSSTLTLPDDELMQALRSHNAAFTSLLSLIPAELYVARDEDDDDNGENSEQEQALFVQDMLRDNSDNATQAPSKDELAAQKRAYLKESKRAKVSHVNCIIDIQTEFCCRSIIQTTSRRP